MSCSLMSYERKRFSQARAKVDYFGSCYSKGTLVMGHESWESTLRSYLAAPKFHTLLYLSRKRAKTQMTDDSEQREPQPLLTASQ